MHHQGLGTMRPQAACFPRSDDVAIWEMYDFHMDMGSCFHSMSCTKHQGSHVEIAHFHTPFFCMCQYMSVKSAKCYRDGQKSQFISSGSDSLPGKCTGHYAMSHQMITNSA